jgi:hypothetical protein
MRTILVALLALSCTGCALVAPYENDAVRNTEYTWVGLHAIDTAQTVTIARSPTCLREANPAAAWIYGSDHPSASRVVLTNVALGYAHYRIGGWIDSRTERAALDPDDDSYNGWYLFRAAWHGFAIFGSGYAVLHNAQARVGPFSARECK